MLTFLFEKFLVRVENKSSLFEPRLLSFPAHFAFAWGERASEVITFAPDDPRMPRNDRTEPQG